MQVEGTLELCRAVEGLQEDLLPLGVAIMSSKQGRSWVRFANHWERPSSTYDDSAMFKYIVIRKPIAEQTPGTI